MRPPVEDCDETIGRLTPNAQGTARAGRRRVWLGATAFAVAAALLIFALPLLFPPPWFPTVSASYIAGFNNRIAVLATAACSVAVLLWSARRALRRKAVSTSAPRAFTGDDGTPDAWHRRSFAKRFADPVLLAGLALTALTLSAAGVLVMKSHMRYLADAGYMIEQMSVAGDFRRVLYRDLEFAYGPLLFYPTVLLHRVLPFGWQAAYFMTLVVDSLIGLLLLWAVLTELPMRHCDRRIAFALFAVGAISPLLGLNYTFLRFAMPFAVLLFATRSGRVGRTALLLAVGEVVTLAISPELGLALLPGITVFALLRVWHVSDPVAVSSAPRRWDYRWLVAVLLPGLGAAALLLLLSGQSLHTLHSFSRGSLNLPVAPYPHLLVLLFAAVWLVPNTFGALLWSGRLRDHRLIACYVLALALLPAALGRCDPLHVFFNGAGLLCLSLTATREYSKSLRLAWLGAIVVLVGWMLYVNNELYRYRTADTLRVTVLPRIPAAVRRAVIAAAERYDDDLADHLRPGPSIDDYRLDVRELERIVGNAPVATPLEVSLRVEAGLRRSGHYAPSYYAFFVDVFTRENEAEKIAELNRFGWALIPRDAADPFIETPRDIGEVQGFTFPYRERRPIPYPLGNAFTGNLDNSWVVTRSFGPYVLYRNAAPEQ